MPTIKNISAAITFFTLLLFSPFSQAASQAYIPDSALVTNIDCSNGIGKPPVQCSKQFTIKDMVWSSGVYGCNYVEDSKCMDANYPIENSGSYIAYSDNPVEIIVKLFKGIQKNYEITNSNRVITGYRDCRYDTYNFYSCEMYGYDKWEGHPNVPFDAIRFGAYVVFYPINCPNNGIYVNGKGCTTDGYTDSNGVSFKTNRTAPIKDEPSACFAQNTNGDLLAEIKKHAASTDQCRGDPISIASRAVVESKMDLAYPIPFTRTYISTRTVGADLGIGWKHNFDRKLFIDSSTDAEGSYPTLLTFEKASGNEILFARNSRAENFNLLYQDQTGIRLNVQPDSYTLYLQDGSVETYNLNGGLTQIILANGTNYKVTRDTNNNLLKITNHYGQYINITMAGGVITQITSSNGDALVYNYNNNQLASAVLNNSPSISYTYNANQKLSAIIDELNQPYANFTYNEKGEAIQNARILDGNKIEQHDFNYTAGYVTETQPNGNYVTYTLGTYLYKDQIQSFSEDNRSYSISYDDKGNINTYTNHKNGSYRYTYDSNNLITSLTKPNGSVTSVTWDYDLRLPLTVTEPYANGDRVTTLTYDNYRNLKTKTVSTNEGTRVWTYAYAVGGKLLSATNPDGTSVTYTYYGLNDPLNLKGLIKTIKNGLNQTITINSYDARANPTSITGINGVTKTMTYNIRGQVLTETLGSATNTYTYNNSGDLTLAKMATGYQLSMVYDTAHRLISMYDNHGGVTSFVLDDTTSNPVSQDVFQNNNLVATRNQILDSLGRITSMSHANSSKITSFNYDGDDNISSTTDANSTTSRITRDSQGNVINTSDPAYASQNIYDVDDNMLETNINYYQKTSMIYNGFKELTQLTSPDTGTHTYSIDLANRNTSHTDNAGIVHTTQYDLAGNPTLITHRASTGTLTENIYYNTNGTVNNISDLTGKTSYLYDSLGRVSRKTQTIAGKSFSINYGYNAANQLATETYPSGLIVHYNYNNGLLTSITTTGSKTANIVTDIGYQSILGKPVSWNLGSNNPVTAIYSSDETLTNFNDSIIAQAITTDNVGNVLAINDTNNNYTLNANYNAAYQLTTGDINSNNYRYYYEYNLNLQGKTENGLTHSFNHKQFTNQLTQLVTPQYEGVSIVSDSNGNITSDNKGAYTYDLKNNMISSTSNNITGNYNFNASNQRVAKTVNGVTTYFVYNDRHQLIGEYDSSGNVISEHIYFGLRPVGLYHNNQMYKVHSDYLGTPRIITDQSNTPVWKWLNLNVYGSNLPSLENITYNLRFAGQYFDNESKLHYNYYRTYNPETGRYMQSDPIGLAAGANTYNYVGGNPLNGIDPLGLESVEYYLDLWTNSAFDWDDALSTAKREKMKPLKDECGEIDMIDADNRTAAEHYIFARALRNTKIWYFKPVSFGYLLVGLEANFYYQFYKTVSNGHGILGKTSKASINQLDWENKGWSDSIPFKKNKYYNSNLDLRTNYEK